MNIIVVVFIIFFLKRDLCFLVFFRIHLKSRKSTLDFPPFP